MFSEVVRPAGDAAHPDLSLSSEGPGGGSKEVLSSVEGLTADRCEMAFDSADTVPHGHDREEVMDACTRPLGFARCIRQAFLWTFLPSCLPLLFVSFVGHAQVVTNITSSGLNTQISQAGNSYNITGGTRPGNGPNLFHSFGNFSIGTGDIGNFQNTLVNGSFPLTSNILGRVTGGNISNIYGTIQTTNFGAANLFLMNPSGIVLGPTASLDVGGSVNFTTAQYIRLQDGLFANANFYANPASDGLANSILAINPSAFEFLSASPAAYGFLTAPDPNATITVQGSALSIPSAPDGSPSNSLSLVGGNVVIEGGAQLSAPSGRIHLATAASPGEFAALPGESLANATLLQSVPNNPVDPASAAAFTSYGLVSLAPNSSIDVHGTRTVFIKGGQLVLSLNDAMLSTTETPTSPGTTDTISLSSGSSIVTSNSGTDIGADVQVTVGNLMVDGSTVSTTNTGDVNGGSISLNATKVDLTNGALIQSSTGLDFTTGMLVGSGTGGNVMVQGLGGGGSPADSVTLSNSSAMQTLTFGPGRGGKVELVAGTLTMDSSALQTAAVGGGGAGGDLALNVGTANLLGGASILTINQNSNPESGQGGNVIIQGLKGVGSAAESMTLSRGSSLSTQTFGSSDGGGVAITSKSLTMDGVDTTISASTIDVGHGGDVVVSVQQASLSGGAIIKTQTSSAQAGPTLTLQGLQGAGKMADSVVVSGLGSGIISESSGTGRAGDIAVHAMTVSLADEAVIQAGTLATSAAGGNVTIDADSVNISGGSSISSQASHLDAGQIAITGNTFSLDHSSITTNTASEGRAGDITINVGTLSLSNGSQISSASTGTAAIPNPDGTGTTEPPGPAGNITISATGSFTSDASTIATSAEANHGGNISIGAQNVQLSNGTLINASSNAPLQVTKLVLDQNGQLVPEVVGNGNAGNITITSASDVIMENSSMTTAASQASGGQISINTPDMAQLINSEIITSVAGSASDTTGGDITIDPTYVILQGSQILAQANAGTGGNITITSNVFLADPNSVVDASSTLGVSGVVDIRSPVSNISGVIGRLPESVLAAQALLRAACAARLAESQVSSFVERGRDSIPPGPDWLLATPYLPPSSESSMQSSATTSGTGREPWSRMSGIQARRLLGPDSTAHVQLLTDDIACGS